MRTKEEVERIIDSLDFDEIRRISIFESGKIWIHQDGTISHVTDGTIPNPAENTVIAILPCSGRGNVDDHIMLRDGLHRRKTGTISQTTGAYCHQMK